MTETMSLNQLAKESGRSKAELKKLREEGTLIGEQDKTGNQRFRFIRASAVAAGILPNRAATTHPRHDGTIDSALRAAIADELQPVVALLTNRIPDIEHTVVGMLPKFLAPAGVWCAARGLECETAISGVSVVCALRGPACSARVDSSSTSPRLACDQLFRCADQMSAGVAAASLFKGR